MAVRRKCTKQPVEHGLISIINHISGDTCPIHASSCHKKGIMNVHTHRQVHNRRTTQQPNNPTTNQQQHDTTINNETARQQQPLTQQRNNNNN